MRYINVSRLLTPPQACTELPLEPISSDGFGFFPPADGDEAGRLARNCARIFGAETRPRWLPLSFGGGEAMGRTLTNVFFGENDKVRVAATLITITT